MTALKLEILKKRAEIDSSFTRESAHQKQILQEIQEELELENKKLSPKDRLALEDVFFWGTFTKESERLSHSLVTKAVLYCKLRKILEELNYFIDDHFYQELGIKDTLSKKEIERILCNFFREVDDAIELINHNRSVYELVVDFLKSALNFVCYVLSFTTHPGFFSTSAQPLYETKSSVIKLIDLKNELAQLSNLDAKDDEDLQTSLNTGKKF
ncbi:hypothetical protein [Legionella parisiensis]|uniref:Uncharacterized protein n=1 Tax=Legionella parisiensis TaxID=45071 RepID=A0A1E5JMS5_9GAMM|nr:hypothetical protein [Legionella parisiensis]KTD41429.1 hypothetical protein Lpar_2746 [Legionella parisiensis]OEH45812.1 hypothetical protein lpari_03219 [Legionella parisiensis]STX76267.1 Uncharacterised protein [Legionella parisiensis]